MSSPDINAFLDSLDRHTGEFVEAVKRRAPVLSYVESADKLGNLSDFGVEELFRVKIRQHMARTAQNIHGVDPTEIGTHPANTFDTELHKLANKSSAIPFSFYGDSEYLDPTVTRSFESAATWTRWGTVGMFLEDNGTLMILRPGTDGSRVGLYYSYLRDAANNPDVTDVVSTNTRYQPDYFPAGQIAMGVLFNNEQLIIGTLGDAETFERTGYFVSRINGTFDQRQHTGVVIPLNDILDPKVASDFAIPGEDGVIYGRPCGYLDADRVFILTDLYTPSSWKLGWKVWSFPAADLISGTYSGAVPETGWTIDRGTSGLVVSDDLVLVEDVRTAGLYITPDVSDLWQHHNRMMYDNTVIRTEDGKLIISGGIETYIFKADNTTFTMFSAFMNAEIGAGRTVDVSRYYNNPTVLSYPSDPYSQGSMAWPYTDSPLFAYKGIQNHVAKIVPTHDVAKCLYSEDKTVFVFKYYVLSGNLFQSISRYQYPETATVLDLMDGSVAPISVDTGRPKQSYPSSVTVYSNGLCNAGDDVLFGVNYRPELGREDYFRAEYIPSFSYQYDSINGHEYLGFAPSSNRSWLSAAAGNQSDLVGCVNESDEAGWILHKGRFDNAVNTSRSRAALIDRFGNGAGQITVIPAAFEALRSQIMIAIGSAGYTVTDAIPGMSLWYELIVPQRYTDLPPFIYGMFVDDERKIWFFVGKVSSAGQRQNLVELELDLTSFQITAIASPLAVNLFANGENDTAGSGQVCIRRIGDKYVVGLTSSVRVTVIGNRLSFSALMTYEADTWSVNSLRGNSLSVSHIGFVNFPTLGMFLTFCSDQHLTAVDAATKVVATPIAQMDEAVQTFETYLGRIVARNTDCRVILSQEVPSNWVIYFTDVTPAMIDGEYVELPAYTHNFDPATSANKRFHVWLVRTGVSVEYLLDDGTTAPSGVDGYLYLGFVDTDDFGVSLIAVSKQVAIAGKSISAIDMGSTIPVTPGLPSQASRLTWR